MSFVLRLAAELLELQRCCVLRFFGQLLALLFDVLFVVGIALPYRNVFRGWRRRCPELLLLLGGQAFAIVLASASPDERNAIIASEEELRDRLALRLLLDNGLRKGAVRAVQFEHFDHQRRRLTIFTQGQAIRALPIPQTEF